MIPKCKRRKASMATRRPGSADPARPKAPLPYKKTIKDREIENSICQIDDLLWLGIQEHTIVLGKQLWGIDPHW
jgi:hypothetical protein